MSSVAILKEASLLLNSLTQNKGSQNPNISQTRRQSEQLSPFLRSARGPVLSSSPFLCPTAPFLLLAQLGDGTWTALASSSLCLELCPPRSPSARTNVVLTAELVCPRGCSALASAWLRAPAGMEGWHKWPGRKKFLPT